MSTFFQHWDETEPRPFDHWLEEDSSHLFPAPPKPMKLDRPIKEQEAPQGLVLKLRPSEAARWMKCTLSPLLIAQNRHRIPEENSSKAADEGVVAHSHAANALVLGYDEDDFGNNVEMADYVLDYVLYVQSHMEEGLKLQVEREISVYYKADQRGFLDAIVLKKSGFAIIDLKYGSQISVQAVDNPQILIYAMSVYNEFKAKGVKFKKTDTVEMVIFQPRVHGQPAIREWVITVGEMLERGKELEKIAKQILRKPDGGVFHADEKTCQFCDAKPFCTAYATMLFDEIPMEMSELLDESYPVDEPMPSTLTHEQIKRAIMVGPKLVNWINACTAYATKLLREGKEFPGFKIVESSPNRKWVDPVDAELYLAKYLSKADRTQPEELITPAQAEKVLKRLKAPKSAIARLETVITRPPGAPVIAPIGDKRPPMMDIDVHAEFENLDPEN